MNKFVRDKVIIMNDEYFDIGLSAMDCLHLLESPYWVLRKKATLKYGWYNFPKEEDVRRMSISEQLSILCECYKIQIRAMQQNSLYCGKYGLGSFRELQLSKVDELEKEKLAIRFYVEDTEKWLKEEEERPNTKEEDDPIIELSNQKPCEVETDCIETSIIDKDEDCAPELRDALSKEVYQQLHGNRETVINISGLQSNTFRRIHFVYDFKNFHGDVEFYNGKFYIRGTFININSKYFSVLKKYYSMFGEVLASMWN